MAPSGAFRRLFLVSACLAAAWLAVSGAPARAGTALDALGSLAGQARAVPGLFMDASGIVAQSRGEPETAPDGQLGRAGRKSLPAWADWAGAGLVAALAVLGLFVLALRKLAALRTAELNKALASLGESERRFRSTFEQAAVGIAHKDSEGRWLLVNQKFCDILGYTPDEMRSLTFRDVTHPDDLDKEQDSLALLLDGRIPMYSLEKRYVRKDGGLVWMDLTASLAPGTDASPPYVITVVQDISERKRVERELERARQYIRNIINSMPSVVIGVDAQGRVTHFNLPAAKLLADPAASAVGVPLDKAFPTFAAQMDSIRQAISDRAPVLMEKKPFSLHGEVRYRDVLVYPLVADGVEGAVLRVDDVTERVRLTEMLVQSGKMMSVGGLAAGMAHEINNPLGAILQSAQVIQMHVDPAFGKNREVALECGCSMEAVHEYMRRRKILEFLDGIREAGSRAARIVANMLAFSRRGEARREMVFMDELLDDSVTLAGSDYDLKKKYDFRHIDIRKEYAQGLPPVPCSRTEIEQVFLNLLKNAAQAMAQKYYSDGRPTITLRTECRGDRVAITVEDNGPGMEETVSKRVFEPFFTTKEPGQGTGLGLSVSYFIVTSNHGGTISVDSAPGAGARFIVELPAAGPLDAPPA